MRRPKALHRARPRHPRSRSGRPTARSPPASPAPCRAKVSSARTAPWLNPPSQIDLRGMPSASSAATASAIAATARSAWGPITAMGARNEVGHQLPPGASGASAATSGSPQWARGPGMSPALPPRPCASTRPVPVPVNGPARLTTPPAAAAARALSGRASACIAAAASASTPWSRPARPRQSPADRWRSRKGHHPVRGSGSR